MTKKQTMKQLGSPLSKLQRFLFFTIILFLPSQLGKHFWPPFAFVSGIRVDYLSPTLYITDVLIIILFLTWITSVFPVLKSRIRKYELRIRVPSITPNSLFIILFFVFILIGIALSTNPLAGIYGLLKLCEFVFFGWYTAQAIKEKRDIQGIALLFSLGIMFESILAIAQFVSQSFLGGIFYFFGERAIYPQNPGAAVATLDGQLILRSYGTFPHPNVLAGYLTIAMTLVVSSSMYYVLRERKIFSYLLIGLGAIALFLTMSRVAIVVWIGIIMFYLIRHYGSSSPSRIFEIFDLSRIDSGVASLPRMTVHKKIIRLLIVLVFICSIGSIITFSSLRFRFGDIFGESLSERVRLVNISLEMIKTHPVFGVGLYNFISSIPSFYIPKTGSFFAYMQPVHNIFLLVASETGLVGLFFFGWFLLKTFNRMKNNELRIKGKISIIPYSSFFIPITLGMFDHYFLTIQQGQLLLAFVFGMCWVDVLQNDIISKEQKEHVVFLSPLH